MKKILFVAILIAFSVFSFAGVIMTTNNERIEDVSIQNETDSAIVYLQDGVEKSIAIEQVSAILYDDGQFKEFYQNSLFESSSIGEYRSSLVAAKIELEKLQKDPALAMKLAFDPAFASTVRNIAVKQEAEYKNVLSSEIAKGTPKKLAKQIAKQAKDSIATIEILEYIRKNPIGNK